MFRFGFQFFSSLPAAKTINDVQQKHASSLHQGPPDTDDPSASNKPGARHRHRSASSGPNSNYATKHSPLFSFEAEPQDVFIINVISCVLEDFTTFFLFTACLVLITLPNLLV